nr:zinc ribbon domain-containing protein [Candidatus Sigynarchaeum springense]
MKTQIGWFSSVNQPAGIAVWRPPARRVATNVARQPDQITPKNLKADQILGPVIISVAVVAVILKAIGGEIDTSNFAGGMGITINIAGSIVPAAILLVVATLLKRQTRDDVNLKLGFSIVLVPASAIGLAATAYLASLSLFMLEPYPVLLVLLPGGDMAGRWLALSVAAAVIQYGAMALYIVSLTASVKVLQMAVVRYKGQHADRYWNTPYGQPAGTMPRGAPGIACRRCGTVNDPRAQFCGNCGGSLY